MSNIGPLVLVAVLYELLGIVFAFIIKQFFWVPHRFRYGIIVAGGWGNVGDIRESYLLWTGLIVYTIQLATSVIMSVTGAIPFRGVEDQNLAVAYISAFILVFMVRLPCFNKTIRSSVCHYR